MVQTMLTWPFSFLIHMVVWTIQEEDIPHRLCLSKFCRVALPCTKCYIIFSICTHKNSKPANKYNECQMPSFLGLHDEIRISSPMLLIRINRKNQRTESTRKRWYWCNNCTGYTEYYFNILFSTIICKIDCCHMIVILTLL